MGICDNLVAYLGVLSFTIVERVGMDYVKLLILLGIFEHGRSGITWRKPFRINDLRDGGI